MTHTYNVTGMTCNGCKASVEKALQSLDHVTDVSVDLENAEVEIGMSKHISINTLQDALSSKYTINKKSKENNVFDSVSKEKESQIRQLFPLFLIFGGLMFQTLC